MKTLLKFVVSILIILLIVGTVLVLINNNEVPNDGPKEDVTEKEKTDIEKMAEIDEYVSGIDSISFVSTIKDNLGVEILGEDVKDYIEFFTLDTVYVDIYKKEQGRIEISPAPDVIKNQVFYYKDGKLVLYKSVSNTIGGELKYYFENDKLIATKTVCEEDDIAAILSSKMETQENIIERANKVYEKYMK